MSEPVSRCASSGRSSLRRALRAMPGQDVLRAAHAVLLAGQSDYQRERYASLAAILEMAEDEDWVLQSADRQRLINVLAGFVLALDAVGVEHLTMIELASRELRHDLDAYQEFRQIRAGAARRYSPHDMDRERWLADRRDQLQVQMRQRRERDQHHVGGIWRRWRSLLNF